MPLRWLAPNPCSDTFREYVPGSTAENVKAPFDSDTIGREAPVPVLINSTVAPGSASPCSSATVPVTTPAVLVCAEAGVPSSNDANATTARTTDRPGLLWPAPGTGEAKPCASAPGQIIRLASFYKLCSVALLATKSTPDTPMGAIESVSHRQEPRETADRRAQ
jgi:hypothetical protein